MTTETTGLDLDGLRQTIAANNWAVDALEIFGDLIAEVERLRHRLAIYEGSTRVSTLSNEADRLSKQIATAKRELIGASVLMPLRTDRAAWQHVSKALEALK